MVGGLLQLEGATPILQVMSVCEGFKHAMLPVLASQAAKSLRTRMQAFPGCKDRLQCRHSAGGTWGVPLSFGSFGFLSSWQRFVKGMVGGNVSWVSFEDHLRL